MSNVIACPMNRIEARGERRRKTLGAAVVGAAMFAALPASAQSTFCEAGAVVYYVNGMWNTNIEAAANLLILEERLARTTTSLGQPIAYEYTHNPDDGRIDQYRAEINAWIAADPARAPVANSVERIFAAVANGELTALLLALQQTTDPRVRISAAVAQQLRSVIIAEIPELLAGHSRVNEIAPGLRTALTSFVDRGNRVVVVAHSQANYLVNAAYAQLPTDKQPSVSVVALASPASSVPGSDGIHYTLQQDVVLNVPGRRPPNVAQTSACPADPLNHALGQCYLQWTGTNAPTLIRNAMSAAADRQAPPGIIANGVIVGTLRWGAQGDLDFHAFEPAPGNEHVYYMNRSGPTATLDLDDTFALGPENIFVCDDPTVGSYRFGVNYYSGEGTETANVELYANGLRRQMPPVVLTTPGGGAGDTSPIPVGAVIVSRDAQGRLVYQIQ